MKRRQKTSKDIRTEAYGLAQEFVRERWADGDPEGAGVIEALAVEIARISLVEDAPRQKRDEQTGDEA